MTNFKEEQQREVQTKAWAMFAGKNELTAHDVLDEITKQTITNTLNHILESGLLEEYKRKHDPEGVDIDPVACRQQAHNTLARDIKEFISKMDSV